VLHCFLCLRTSLVAVVAYVDGHFSVLIADLENRETKLLKLALIINLDVKDNHEEAAIGGKLALDLCQRVRACSSLDL
jgi:RNA polymerase II subunit A C-terminal domain phosphatase SSU72